MGCVHDKNSLTVSRKSTLGLESTAKSAPAIRINTGSESEYLGRDENYLRDDDPINLPIDPFYDFLSAPLKLPETGVARIPEIPSR